MIRKMIFRLCNIILVITIFRGLVFYNNIEMTEFEVHILALLFYMALNIRGSNERK